MSLPCGHQCSRTSALTSRFFSHRLVTNEAQKSPVTARTVKTTRGDAGVLSPLAVGSSAPTHVAERVQHAKTRVAHTAPPPHLSGVWGRECASGVTTSSAHLPCCPRQPPAHRIFFWGCSVVRGSVCARIARCLHSAASHLQSQHFFYFMGF